MTCGGHGEGRGASSVIVGQHSLAPLPCEERRGRNFYVLSAMMHVILKCEQPLNLYLILLSVVGYTYGPPQAPIFSIFCAIFHSCFHGNSRAYYTVLDSSHL